MGIKVRGAVGRGVRQDDSLRPPREDETGLRMSDRATSKRVKRLSAIAAASLCVAVIASLGGVWALLSSRSIVVEAKAGAQPTLVTVEAIEAGDAIAATMLKVVDVPRGFRVEGALTSDESSADGSIIGKRALVDIPAGSQMVSSFLSGAVGGGYLAAALDAGMQAVTVAVDVETGLSGQLRPFDRVRVVAVDEDPSGEVSATTLCERSRVVALDDRLSGGGEGYTSVTLEVDALQADDIRMAQHAGTVGLVLVSPLDGEEAAAHG